MAQLDTALLDMALPFMAPALLDMLLQSQEIPEFAYIHIERSS